MVPGDPIYSQGNLRNSFYAVPCICSGESDDPSLFALLERLFRVSSGSRLTELMDEVLQESEMGLVQENCLVMYYLGVVQHLSGVHLRKACAKCGLIRNSPLCLS